MNPAQLLYLSHVFKYPGQGGRQRINHINEEKQITAPGGRQVV